ncbi:hypothetical protein GCM10023315_03910 [Algibacter aquimarinus]|uniref:Uncharacterized protein n=1 Tax=Algibacter aquimarinus TaxID=1136748 RepID=A0ABP9H1U2_9FLAO
MVNAITSEQQIEIGIKDRKTRYILSSLKPSVAVRINQKIVVARIIAFKIVFGRFIISYSNLKLSYPNSCQSVLFNCLK